MPSLLQELPALVGSFRVLSSSAFEVWGDRYSTSRDAPSVQETTLDATAISRLADVLYSALHCRLTIEAWAASLNVDPARGRTFVHALSRANRGRGPWQTGWVVRNVADDGTCAVEHLGASFSASRGSIRSRGDRPEPGEAVAVRVPREYRHLIGGFYTALGDADDSLSSEPTTRVYWHVRASGAEALTRDLTGALNDAGIPFWLKLADAPEKYRRADAAVLYLPRMSYRDAEPIIAQVARTLAAQLRDTTSAFAMRIAPGVAVADEPALKESFGQHRSRVLAEAFAAASGTGDVDMGGRVVSALTSAGIDPRAPHLDRGSSSVYRALGDMRHAD